jgi:hypothetical protein
MLSVAPPPSFTLTTHKARAWSKAWSSQWRRDPTCDVVVDLNAKVNLIHLKILDEEGSSP